MSPADVARFFKKADRSGGPEACWPWLACIRRGYGAFGRDGRTQRAHRVAYELANGPIPEGLYVCHRCDVPLCVNPAHLFLGTHNDNEADKVVKGRQSRGAKHRVTCGKKTSPHASQYRGVYWDARPQKWKAHISVAGRQLHLGYFRNEHMAAAAYNLAVLLIENGVTDPSALRATRN